MRPRTFLLFGMATALMCSGAQPPARAADAGDKAEVTRLVNQYFAALNASDTGAILKLYSDDGVFLQPGASSWIGKTAIGRAYDMLFRTSKVDTDVRLAEIILMSPDWAFGRAVAGGAITNRKTGSKEDGPTQELFVFRKLPDGWRIARFAFSPTASPSRVAGR